MIIDPEKIKELSWEEISEPEWAEHVDEKGRIRTKVKQVNFYGNDSVELIGLRYYYKKYKESFEEWLVASKDKDLSKPSIPLLINAFEDYKSKLHLDKFDYITIMPRSKSSDLFSPTLESLGNELSKHSKIPFRKLIRQIKFYDNNRSKEKNYQDKFDKVHGSMAMAVDTLELKGKRILLLDDLKTAGFHILECNQLLKSGGATELITICIAVNTNNEPPKKS